MKLLVTGSSGFIGAKVCEMANDASWQITRVQRKKYISEEGRGETNKAYLVAQIDSKTDWSGAFEDIDCVVHCAARVHQMRESESDALSAYAEINTAGTLNLAKQAVEAGVKRFVFISSIKVNGESTEESIPFEPHLDQKPTDPYGLSKYDAEVGLHKIAEETGLEVAIIRPPLVYGEGVKANFQNLMKAVYKGLPLPLGAIKNQRSLVYRDNLVDLILTCCQHPKAKGQVFLVSDGKDVSTTKLVALIAKSMNKANRMMPIPMSWIRLGSRLIGKPQISQRICSNLQVDMSNTKELLGWKPKISTEEGIRRTVQAFLKSNS